MIRNAGSYRFFACWSFNSSVFPKKSTAWPTGGIACQGFSTTLNVDSIAEAERIYNELKEGGTVKMALQETFWAVRFAMLVDRFGIPWMINCQPGS